MKNIYGFTHPQLLERMDTLKDTPEAVQRLMHWIKSQGEVQVCPNVWMIAYEDGTYGYKTEPKGLVDRLPDVLTDFLYEWVYHYGTLIDDGSDDETFGQQDVPDIPKFYGE